MAAYQLGRNGEIRVATTTALFTSLTSLQAIEDEASISAQNSAMDTEVASLAVFGNVGDVTINRSSQEIDYTTRDSGGFDATANVSKTVEITGTSNVRVANQAQLDAIEAAYEAQREIAALILSAPRTTALARGYLGNWNVTTATESQPVKGVMTVQWTFKSSTIIPYTVAAS